MRSVLAPITDRSVDLRLARLAQITNQIEAPLNIGPVVPGFAQFARTDLEGQMRTYGTEPVLFASVSRLATSVGALEWDLYAKAHSRRRDDRTPVEMGHAALDLWDDPNPFMTTDEFVEVSDQHLELTGESYWVIGFDDRAPGLPLSLWPIRPDRFIPVPHPTRLLAGYIYVTHEGQRVPFPTEQVIHLKYPDPLDPYHGLGPVRSLLTDLGSSVAAAQWNRNFFTNSAEPGGVIKVDQILSDPQYDLLNSRWNAQHRGYANAHRVAILEAGMEWVDRSFTMQEMQFVELRKASDEHIMLAFGMSKTLLGQTESVNRATAEAAEYVFSKYQVTPRGRRFRNALNKRLLPLYQRGKALEFDFLSPVTGNVDEENTSRDSRVAAAVALVDVGYDPESVREAFDLPEMVWLGKPAVQATPMQMIEGAATSDPTFDAVMRRQLAALPRGGGGHPKAEGPGPGGIWSVRPRNQDDPPDLDPGELPDVAPLEESHARALADLLESWGPIEDDQKAALVAQVLAIAGTGNLSDLTGLSVDTGDAEDLLADAMAAMAADGAEAMASEAAEQDVTIEAAEPDVDIIDDVAAVVATMIAVRLITSASNTALRVNSTAATATEVADGVAAALDELSPDGPRPMLSGALTGSQNDGRIATLRNVKGTEPALYSSEKNDANTCGPCRAIDGKWLGNLSDLDQVLELYPGGAYGGYVDCDGRERCRGT
ncbi:MAG: phage portal protein, partial [Actinomycetia bacterium]|nr:phage portal protein [Actinomycetes bacterium]